MLLKHLLVNYFKQLFEAVGLQWDSDNAQRSALPLTNSSMAAVTQADLNRKQSQLP